MQDLGVPSSVYWSNLCIIVNPELMQVMFYTPKAHVVYVVRPRYIMHISSHTRSSILRTGYFTHHTHLKSGVLHAVEQSSSIILSMHPCFILSTQLSPDTVSSPKNVSRTSQRMIAGFILNTHTHTHTQQKVQGPWRSA